MGFVKTVFVCVSRSRLSAFNGPPKPLPGLTQVLLVSYRAIVRRDWVRCPPPSHSGGSAHPCVSGVFPNKPADAEREQGEASSVNGLGGKVSRPF